MKLKLWLNTFILCFISFIIEIFLFLNLISSIEVFDTIIKNQFVNKLSHAKYSTKHVKYYLHTFEAKTCLVLLSNTKLMFWGGLSSYILDPKQYLHYGKQNQIEPRNSEMTATNSIGILDVRWPHFIDRHRILCVVRPCRQMTRYLILMRRNSKTTQVISLSNLPNLGHNSFFCLLPSYLW